MPGRDEPHDASLTALQEVYAGILARAPEHDFAPTLDRVEEVCDLLGHPQRAYRVVHVAGTNGKTSTSRMIERLVREHGLRTGLFTSPHLTSVTERIEVDGEPLSAGAFVSAWQDVAPYVHLVDTRSVEAGGPRMSFFEVLTVMAFAAFADAPVDVAVIEVGMGGTWDATNVVRPEVAVVTPIAHDHERWLGHDILDIAGEKAGVLKEHVTAVVAAQREEVEGVLLAAAAERGTRVLREGVDLEVVARQVAVGGQLVDLRTPAGLYREVFVPLHGAHQAHNALLALGAAEALLSGGTVPGPVVEAAFAGSTSPGRLELVRSSPTVLVDAAHNPHGAQALAEAITEAFAFERLVGGVAMLADKDAEAILAALEPVLDEVVVTRTSSDRALEVEELAAVAGEVFGPDRVHLAERLDNALALAVELSEGGVAGSPTGAGVLVTGSVVTAAEARLLFGGRRP
ncbi:MAG TPA: folylpolyglutamate synthase/dihydrofolate synthase family protein [Actinotalea sp.]|nr:folylpolyglutamate synthase/dihydrofolate synthase family protein [Actinotalea sp.]